MKLQYKPNELKQKLEAAIAVAQKEYDSDLWEWKQEFYQGENDFKGWQSKFIKTPWWCFWKKYEYEPEELKGVIRRTWTCSMREFQSCVGVHDGYLYCILTEKPTLDKLDTLKYTLNSLDTSSEYVYIHGNVAKLIKGDE